MQASTADETFNNAAGQGGQNNASGNVETMLDFNALQYEMFPDLSVCTERTMKNAFFQRDNYDANTTAYAVLNSGSDFIDGRNSYLIFNIKYSVSDPGQGGNEIVSWGKSGSAYNIIRRIILTDRAGNELERIENVNRLVAMNQNLLNSEDWFDGYGTQFNHRRGLYDKAYESGGDLITTTADTDQATLKFVNNADGTCTITSSVNLFTSAMTSTGNTNIKVGKSGTVGAPRITIYEGRPTAVPTTQTVMHCAGHKTGPLNYTIENGNPSTHLEVDWSSNLLNNAEADVQDTTWVLPLRWMSGIFDYEQLLPSQLMSGLRIEIQFETADKAFMRSNKSATTISYTINNPRIVLDSCKLTDAIQRELNERSANDGLEIVYRTWWSTESVVNSTQINLESRKAVSRAFRALTCIYDVDNAESQSMVPAKFDYDRWQYRAGNLYFPNQPVTSSGTETGLVNQQHDVVLESYNHLQKMFAKNKELWWDSSQGVTDWAWKTFPNVTTNQIGDANAGFAILCADLERTTVQDLSGIPLNNSRVLALQARLKNTGNNRPIIMFMQYLKIARIFLDNTEVEE